MRRSTERILTSHVGSLPRPDALIAGNDEAHPGPISDELNQLLPNCEFIREWKSSAALEAARPGVKAFLAQQTPPGA